MSHWFVFQYKKCSFNSVGNIHYCWVRRPKRDHFLSIFSPKKSKNFWKNLRIFFENLTLEALQLYIQFSITETARDNQLLSLINGTNGVNVYSIGWHLRQQVQRITRRINSPLHQESSSKNLQLQ